MIGNSNHQSEYELEGVFRWIRSLSTATNKSAPLFIIIGSVEKGLQSFKQ